MKELRQLLRDGYNYFENKDFKKAREYLERGLTLKPNEDQKMAIYEILGIIYCNNPTTRETGISYYQKYLKYNPSNKAEVIHRIADLYYRNRK